MLQYMYYYLRRGITVGMNEELLGFIHWKWMISKKIDIKKQLAPLIVINIAEYLI